MSEGGSPLNDNLNEGDDQQEEEVVQHEYEEKAGSMITQVVMKRKSA